MWLSEAKPIMQRRGFDDGFRKSSTHPTHYVSGRNEPDLATLARIARTLQTTPNELLGFGPEPKRSRRTVLRERLNAAADAMDDRELEITVVQAEAIAAL